MSPPADRLGDDHVGSVCRANVDEIDAAVERMSHELHDGIDGPPLRESEPAGAAGAKSDYAHLQAGAAKRCELHQPAGERSRWSGHARKRSGAMLKISSKNKLSVKKRVGGRG